MCSVMEAQRRSGRREVHSYEFAKSGHVAHYKHYPEQYTQLVKEFMDKI